MRRIALALGVLVCLCSSVQARRALSSAQEQQVLMGVVHQCDLNPDEAKLLFAIRQHENGPTGMEFGIGQDVGRHHPARRSIDPKTSLRIQGEWAAGTIQKCFNGNLKAFARKWCPKGSWAWHRSVSRILMVKYSTPVRVQQRVVQPVKIKLPPIQLKSWEDYAPKAGGLGSWESYAVASRK